ncbi:hypothetical protein ACGFYU_33210 [Streptomyces sp. NPDC048337]|uniref:hypothetical protein n=1 Tax=Streptomyces sp. NPDC048337 TaxID=3365535 RepID=UPI00371366F8
MSIGTFELPEEIVGAMLAGSWKFERAAGFLTEVLPDRPTAQAVLYSLEAMVRETGHWWAETPEQASLYGAGPVAADGYVSVPVAESVLIGDLGFDMPLALHYRVGEPGPRLMYLPAGGPGWIEVAPDVRPLTDALR